MALYRRAVTVAPVLDMQDGMPELRPVRDAELLAGACDVCAHRHACNAQYCRDLLVRQPFAEKRDNLLLARCGLSGCTCHVGNLQKYSRP